MMEMYFMYRYLISCALICLGLMTQGCFLTKETVHPLVPALPEKFVTKPEISDLKITKSLLDLVKDEQARTLVTEALESNHDLQATALRLKSTGLLLSQTNAARLPAINAEYAPGRNNQTLNRDAQSNHRVSLSFSWELDIWGKLADQHHARELGYKALQLDYYRAMDSLAARVIQAWLRIKANKMNLDVHEKRVKIYHNLETTTLEKYKSGLGHLRDISAARSRTNQARASLTRAREIYLSSVRNLELLLGRYPSTSIVVGDGLPDVILTNPSIPAQVLANRPDVQAALNRAMSAVNDASAAQKELLPNIRLTGNIFRDNSRLSRLGSAENAWNLLGSVLFPIFNAGRIEDEAESAKKIAQAAYQDFGTIVLNAMKEVENSIARENHLKERLHFLEMALDDARLSSDYYEARFKEGLTGIVEIYTARDQELEILFSILAAKASRIVNRIDIALALGTGVYMENSG